MLSELLKRIVLQMKLSKNVLHFTEQCYIPTYTILFGLWEPKPITPIPKYFEITQTLQIGICYYAYVYSLKISPIREKSIQIMSFNKTITIWKPNFDHYNEHHKLENTFVVLSKLNCFTKKCPTKIREKNYYTNTKSNI